jgi:hypothetical protein
VSTTATTAKGDDRERRRPRKATTAKGGSGDG